MIISIERIKQLVDLDGWTDDKIEMKLAAIEQAIRAYTNNNFQRRGVRCEADIINGKFYVIEPIYFDVGDTVQVSESELNAGLFTVTAVEGATFTVKEKVDPERDVLVTKVVYPADVIACAVNLLEWEKANRHKVGIQSETLSRHSVTYAQMNDSNQIMGYPAAILGCLKAYRKARC